MVVGHGKSHRLCPQDFSGSEGWVQTPATPLDSGACGLVAVPRIYVEAGHLVTVSLLQCPCLWCTSQ